MKGWLPNQHGAWAILAVPAILGSWTRYVSAESTLHLWTLIPLWVVGYFAYFAWSRWLKAPRARRVHYKPAVTVYTVATALFATLTLLLGGWGLAAWALVFLPLIALSLVLVKLGHEHSIVNGIVLVTTAALFYGPCLSPILATTTQGFIWVRIAVLAAFFVASLFAVKSLIRKQGDTRWWIASMAVNVLLLVFVVAMAAMTHLKWPLAFVAGLWVVRSAVLPFLQRRGVKLRPLVIGLVELVLFLALLYVMRWP